MTNGKINRSVKLAGMGNALGGSQLVFGGEKRYRLRPGESLLDLACLAAERALEEAGEEIGGMDCIVCAMATPLQAIPCNAALVHERMARGWTSLPWTSIPPAPASSAHWTPCPA